MRPTLDKQEKFYEEFLKAYNKLKKKLGRNPTQSELLRSMGKQSAEGLRTAKDIFGLKFFNKPGEFKTPPDIIGAKTEKGLATKAAKEVVKQPAVRGGKLAFPTKKMEKEFTSEVKKKFKYPVDSLEAKKAKVLTFNQFNKKFYKNTPRETSDKHVRLLANQLVDPKTGKKGLEYPKQTYEGELKKAKIIEERRKKFIKKVSKPAFEKDIIDAKRAMGLGREGANIDLAHRASLKQLSKFNAPLLAGSLGLDTKIVNSELIKPFEEELDRLYKKQNKIAKRFKGRAIPLSAQKEISVLNNKIQDLVMKTKGVIQGVLMNEKTGGFASVQGLNPRINLGAGLLDDVPLRTMTPEQRVLATQTALLNIPEQAKQQKLLGRQIKRALLGAASLTPAGRFARIARFLKKEGGMADEDMMVDIKSYDGLDRSTYPSNSMQREALFASPVEDPKQKKRSAILDLELV